MPAPYTTVNAQTPPRAGLTPTFTPAVAAGHQMVNNKRRFVRFRNTNAAARTVTVQHPTVDGNLVTGVAITVPATTGDVTTQFWPEHYNQFDGTVVWDYSATANLEVAVIDCPPV